jgi:hypothetical protein
LTRVTGARTLSRMRARPGSGRLPKDDDVPVRGRLIAHARPARGRSDAWSSAGRRDLRRQALAGLVIAAVAGSGFLIASRPSDPGLTDPKAILDATTSRFAAARSVHVTVDLDGTVSLGLFSPGAGSAAQPLALTGTHADGDIDLAGRQASLAFEVPALLGLTGRLVELPDGTYLNSTLTGDGWVSVGEGSAQLPAGEPLTQLTNLRTLLTDLGDSATKLDDASCQAGRCYQVRVWLTSAQARALVPLPSAGVSAQPSPPISHTPIADPATATIVAQVDRETLRLAGALIHLDLGDGSALDLDLRFSAWDAPVSIEPPPTDQVAPSVTPVPAS